MIKQVVLTEEEYNDLTERAISKKEYRELQAYKNTVIAELNPIGLCPKCKNYILLDGQICPGCGYSPYDDVYTPEKDDLENKKLEEILGAINCGEFIEVNPDSL